MLVRKGVLSHKPLRIYPLVVAQMLALNTQNVQSLFSAASPHASLPHANDVFLEINKHSVCALHKLCSCPSCHPDEYMRRRIIKAVTGGLKRIGLRKTQSIMTYLGGNSWEQVLEHIEKKRLYWNKHHPHAHMSLTNIAIDHIRPVKLFQSESNGAQTFLCNHYTNLQPLLHDDNHWKSDRWSAADDTHWHAHILLHDEHEHVYYPQADPQKPSLLSYKS